MAKITAIDGACRGNGTPECISAGVAFHVTHQGDVEWSWVQHTVEHKSTSQRGEIMGLILALEMYEPDDLIITDSEYLYKAITNGWPERWCTNGGLLADGSVAKNLDLWQKVYDMQVSDVGICHIKGHVKTMGKKKAEKLFDKDRSCYELYKEALALPIKDDKSKSAHIHFLELHGYPMRNKDLNEFAALNLVADQIATWVVDAAAVEQFSQNLSAGNML